MTNRVGVGRSPENAENAGVSASNARAAEPGDRPEGWPGEASAPDGLWDIGEVADYLKVPRGAIYKMTCRAAAVRIPHIRIGFKLRFRRADIDEWLELLTVSNKEVLTTMRQKAKQVTHGHHSQTDTP